MNIGIGAGINMDNPQMKEMFRKMIRDAYQTRIG